MPAPAHATNAPGPAAAPPNRSRTSRVATTAASATRLPTLRSIPPVRITKVSPAERMATTTIWLATLSRFCRVRNTGQRDARGETITGVPSDGNFPARSAKTVQPAHSGVVAMAPRRVPAASSRRNASRTSRGSPTTLPATLPPAEVSARSKASANCRSSSVARATMKTGEALLDDDRAMARVSAASAPEGRLSRRVTAEKKAHSSTSTPAMP